MLNLIIGGAGSGKSAYAEALVCRLAGPRLYIATMEARDAESRARIERHREQRRGLGFVTLERGTDLAAAPVPPGCNALLEDLPNLLANELFSPAGGGMPSLRRGLEALLSACGSLTVVTGEVFSDGVAYPAQTRDYMRQLAALNRELAARADFVAELVCGLPNRLKGEEA